MFLTVFHDLDGALIISKTSSSNNLSAVCLNFNLKVYCSIFDLNHSKTLEGSIVSNCSMLELLLPRSAETLSVDGEI